MPEQGKDKNKQEKGGDHDNRDKNQKGDTHDNRNKKDRDGSRDRDNDKDKENKKDDKSSARSGNRRRSEVSQATRSTYSRTSTRSKTPSYCSAYSSRGDGSQSARIRTTRSGYGKRGEGSKSARSSRSSKTESGTPRDGRSKQKEYFKEELKRLKSSLDKEASRIVEPDKKEFTPDIFNKLAPYYNTDTPHYLIELPDQIRHGYVSRQTAVGLCDPWIDLEMDLELLPKVESKIPKEDDKKKSKGTPRKSEGSTRLPKYPHICVTTDDLTKNKKIYYDQVPALREELRKKYSIEAEERRETEYKRTKDDFYRMELDKMEEYHPDAKPKMKATYYAYLQNNSGSRKAVRECVKETEDKEKEEDKKEKDKKDKERKDKERKNKKEHRDNRDNRNNKKDKKHRDDDDTDDDDPNGNNDKDNRSNHSDKRSKSSKGRK